MIFYDRKEAGRFLATKLSQYKGNPETLVLGLARGGVVVAYEVAKELSLPLNVVAPRKIGAPGNRELALGSIMENGEGVFNQSLIRMLGVSEKYLAQEIETERARAQKRLALYRQFAPLPDVKNHTIILVDDGIATGSTMLASIKGMRKEEPKWIIAAAPVASTDAYRLIAEAADEVICPYVREDFMAVGIYYSVFGQTEDEEVVNLLKESKKHEKS